MNKKRFFVWLLSLIWFIGLGLICRPTHATKTWRPTAIYPAKPAENPVFPELLQVKNQPAKKLSPTNVALLKQADSLLVKGKKLRDAFKYDSALTLLTKVYQIRKKTGPPLAQAEAASALASVHRSMGKTHLALKLQLATLTEMERENDLTGQIISILSIANSYEQIGNFETSLEYLHHAEKLIPASGPDSLAASIAYSLANKYNYLDSLKTAEKYYRKAIDLYKKNNKPHDLGRALGSLATFLHDMGKSDEAYGLLSAALKTARESNDVIGQASHLNNMAIIHWDKKEFAQAEKQFTEALEMAKITRNIEFQQDVAGNLYYLNKDMGKYKKSLEYLEMYMMHHDTLYNETRSKQIAEMQEKYEAEKRTREIELLRKDQELKEANIVKVNWQRNASLAGAFLLTVVAALIIRNVRQKQKAAALLAAQDHELNSQRIQELLREQELISVHSMLKGQEAERGRIAQDLHDRLGSLLATVKLHVQMAKTPEQQKLVHKLIDEACQEVRQIAHNMISGVLMKFGLVAALKDLANAISLSGKIHMEALSFGLDNRLPNHMEIELYRITQELVSNALKHAQATEITVQVNRQGNILNLLVEDNGIGFSPSAITEKVGMGLRGIEARIKQLNGELIIDSGKGSGTTIMADFPLPEISEFTTITASATELAYDPNSPGR